MPVFSAAPLPRLIAWRTTSTPGNCAGALGDGHSPPPREYGADVGAAAVVHEQDVGHAAAGQVAHQIDQTGGRFVSGDEDYWLDGPFELHGSRLPGSADATSAPPWQCGPAREP